MRKLYIEYKYVNNPEYIGSFKGFFDYYSIWKNPLFEDKISIFYRSGEFYSHANYKDLNLWLDSLGYEKVEEYAVK